MTLEQPRSPAPIAERDRIEALDVLRGFALLGILLLNIIGFGLPFLSYLTPSADGATGGVNFAVYVTVDVLFEGVLRTLFSMLFGAGVVIFAATKTAGPYYRRQLLLLLFGLFNAFVLLWPGDILVPYALAGLVLYLVRDWTPRRLYAGAGVALAYLAIIYSAFCFGLSWLSEQAAEVNASIAAGAEPSAFDRALLNQWVAVEHTVDPPAEERAREALVRQGSYPESLAANADGLFYQYREVLPVLTFWDALAGMLIGMGLYKASILQAKRSRRFYVRLTAVGAAVGLSVNLTELGVRIATDFGLQWMQQFSSPLYDIGRLGLALGFLGLVMLICQRGMLGAARHALAAVGRMALTNYLMQSVICLFIFHDMGLGWWNELQRYQLYFVVAGIWAFQIAFSVWWMARYRFGPMEWLWRTLTYGRVTTMRRG